MARSSCHRPARDLPALDLREEHNRASFSAGHQRASTVLITVEGDVDASNSRNLARFVERHVADSTRLVLDLRLVDFFGTAGFAALHNVNDPDGTLPLEEPQSVLDDLDTGASDRKFLVGGNN